MGGGVQLAEGLEEDPAVPVLPREVEELAEQAAAETLAADLGAEDEPADRRVAAALVGEPDRADVLAAERDPAPPLRPKPRLATA